MRIAGINWGILLGLKGHIAQSQGGITLIESTQIEVSPGDQAGKAKSLKTSSWDHQARVHGSVTKFIISKFICHKVYK